MANGYEQDEDWNYRWYHTNYDGFGQEPGSRVYCDGIFHWIARRTTTSPRLEISICGYVGGDNDLGKFSQPTTFEWVNWDAEGTPADDWYDYRWRPDSDFPGQTGKHYNVIRKVDGGECEYKYWNDPGGWGWVSPNVWTEW